MWWVYFILTLWIGWILVQLRGFNEYWLSDGDFIDFIMYVGVLGIAVGGIFAFILISPFLAVQGLL